MKPTKRSLLDKNTSSDLYREQDLKEEVAYGSSHTETPYSQLKEEVTRTTYNYPQRQNIEMTQMGHRQIPHTPYHPHTQPPQKSTNSAVQNTSNPVTASQINHFPPPQRTVFHIPSHLKGSVMHLTQSGLVVQPRAPFIPPINVECPVCEAKQHIPGDAEQYYCCGCNKLIDIEPKFGLFICGVCRQKVCYPFCTSDHIQCNICYSVNRVPLYPIGYNKVARSKEYHKLAQQDLNESELILPKELRELEPLQRAMEDDQLTTVKPQKEELQDFQK